jgi:hypothetical protein
MIFWSLLMTVSPEAAVAGLRNPDHMWTYMDPPDCNSRLD